MLQTNALLLDRIPIDYAKRFHSILVSIDGTRNVTDFYRSEGVYERVLRNVRWLRSIGFRGDIVARMAVSEQSGIHREVTHLLNLTDPRFDHVHWQLNVVWDAEGNWTDFDAWVDSSYRPGVSQLVREWVSAMSTGVVRGIVPFMPIAHSLLTGEQSGLRCGSGIDTFAIHVDGSIGVCPISPDWGFSIVGDIRRTDPRDLHNIMHVEEPCPSCKDFWICGGRCLFANKQRLWGDEGFEKVCETVRHLIHEIRNEMPRIRQYVEEGLVKVQDFDYPEYNNGCEIIP
jgi:putative peptide-modifying radical SAM enzyme